MQKKIARRGAPVLLAAACALALAAACILAFPATALAEETGVAHTVDSDGMRHYYSTPNEAKQAGYSGATIYMDADWDLGSGSLDIADSKSITIDMCGHKITSSNSDAAIYMNEHASVKITSSEDAHEFKYRGFDSSTRKWAEQTISTSGLIVNTAGNRGIHMEAGSNLTLEKVALAGCGGGIITDKGCTLSLSHATVCHNSTNGDGGGIGLGSSSKLSMVASHIEYNGGHLGGGLFCGEGVTVTMEEGSTVSHNSGSAGGGFYFWKSWFTLKSSDGTGVIADNKATSNSDGASTYNRSGGGIHVDGTNGENQSLIEGLTISGNYAARDSGGIELGQRWTTVKNCTITGNWADYDGGGAFVNGGNNTFENCTITGNYCAGNGGNYEGGGIFVSYHYDVKLVGTCVVRGNTRGKDSGNADDVFLSTVSGGSGKAYITGNLSEGSAVGVRTGISGERRVAKNFSYPASKDCLFADQYSYHISYGTDEGGDAWQRNGAADYTVKVNGSNVAKSKAGSSTTVSAPNLVSSKTFWYWSAEGTKGLDSAEKYINDSTKFSRALTFTMARNDVNLSAVYADVVTKAAVDIETLVGGELLPTTASFSRADGKTSGAAGAVSATVAWYEDVNGKWVASAGRVWPGSTYKAVVSVPQSIKDGRFFSTKIGAGDITVKNGKVESAKVDASTGTLTVEVSLTATGGTQAANNGTVKVACEGKGLLGDDAQEVAALALLDEDADGEPSGGTLLGEFEVSYTYSSDSDEVTITAPSIEGYNFCNWNAPYEWTRDDVDGVVVVPVSELVNISSLTAVYTPVVTKMELAASAPTAGGDDLAESVSELWLTCSDGSRFNLVEAVKSDSLPVSWSPEGADGKAGYSTAYTAMVKVADGAGSLEDVDKVIGANAAITASDGTEATAAGFTVVDGALYLCVGFPATPDVKVTGVELPADVELTFEEASAYAAEQASHPDTLCWPLAGTVSVMLESGEVVDGDVIWEIPSGFNADATAAQEIPVRGTVRIAYPDEVDDSEVTLEVSATIKVAAPEQGGGDGGDTPAVNPGGDSGKGANGGADGAAAFAKTNDPVSAFVMVAAAAAAIAAIAAAVAVALRRRKG